MNLCTACIILITIFILYKLYEYYYNDKIYGGSEELSKSELDELVNTARTLFLTPLLKMKKDLSTIDFNRNVLNKKDKCESREIYEEIIKKNKGQ